MSNSFWNYDFSDPRKRSKLLSLRAPDDPLAYEDDGPPIARSPRLNEKIAEYFAATRDGDVSGRTRAMNAVIDSNRADHAVSGVPAYAHTPLPDDFVARILEPLLKLPAEQQSSLLHGLIASAAPDRRPMVRNQLNERLLSVRAPARTTTPDSRDDRVVDEEAEVELRANKAAAVVGAERDGVPEDDIERVGYAPGNPSAQAQSQQQKRIVKPYRRYAPPGGVGANDAELQEADAIARDADVTIRKLTSRVLGNPQIEQSKDEFLREFARAVRRYYAEDGDRAVAAVAPLLKSQSVDKEDQFASYSSWDDRIYFTRLNRNQSNEEKIVTVIHEVLHAMPTMKKLAATVGYDKAPKGSIVRAQHEAYVDNVAKAIAKRLGLIPQNYPATDWRRYRRS